MVGNESQTHSIKLESWREERLWARWLNAAQSHAELKRRVHAIVYTVAEARSASTGSASCETRLRILIE
jgi:hypothetical protein